MSVVDASVWVAYWVPADAYHLASRRWLRDRLQLFGEPIFGPLILLPEVSGAIARRTGTAGHGQQAVLQMRQLPELKLELLSDDLADAAARLAADLRLRGADAIYVATAQMLGLPLITWDSELLERAAPAVEVREPA